MMWVDTDGCISAPQYCKYFITSVTKGISTAVAERRAGRRGGHFKGGNYVGTLANGGTGLAPFHDLASRSRRRCRPRLSRSRPTSSPASITDQPPSQPTS